MIPGRPRDRLHFGQIHTRELKRQVEAARDRMTTPTPPSDLIELGPCPHCGSSGPTKVGFWPDLAGVNVRPRCVCGASMNAGVTREEQAELWNRRNPQAAYAVVRERIEEIGSAVETAAIWFEEYARLHRAKGTRDGDHKAQVNEHRADVMRSALKQRIDP